jgi:hypothetical protein
MPNEGTKIKWDAVGIAVTVAFAMIAFNAWCMKLVIENAISKNMITIMEKFVTKADFDKHCEMDKVK